MSIMDGASVLTKIYFQFYKLALALHIMRIDFGMETFGKDHEENLIVNVVAEVKWFFQPRRAGMNDSL